MLLLSLIFSSCFFEDNAKRIPVEETEKHFYEYLFGMEDLIEKTIITIGSLHTVMMIWELYR